MNDESPMAQGLVLKVIWGALSSAVLVYLVVLQMVGGDGEQKEEFDTFARLLGMVGVSSLVIAFVIRGILNKKLAGGISEFGIIMTFCIMSWALAESVAIFGLVLGFSGYPMSVCAWFFIASFAAIVSLYPPKIPAS